MNKEQENVWDRLKYGLPEFNMVAVIFHGNGVATKFNSGWLSNCRTVKVTVDDVAKSEYRDFKVSWNDVIFNEPPPNGHKIIIEAYT